MDGIGRTLLLLTVRKDGSHPPPPLGFAIVVTFSRGTSLDPGLSERREREWGIGATGSSGAGAARLAGQCVPYPGDVGGREESRR
ncbi:MAG: hypothetical protein ACOY0T_19755 [Myxococcota bacterium]